MPLTFDLKIIMHVHFFVKKVRIAFRSRDFDKTTTEVKRAF